MKPVRIGIIGAGSVAQSIHIPGFKTCQGVELAAVSDSNAEAAKATGIPEVHNRYQDLLARSDIDGVVVATPNHLHHRIVLAAAARGKHVLCEKPLALRLAEAKEMLRAVQDAGLVHMTAFTYQYAPAVRFAKHLVSTGELGEIRTVRAAYLMALSGHVLGWRSTKQFAGSGVLADIGSHLIHLVRYLVGDITALTAMQHRFRDDPSSDVEDWIAFLANFASGACGTFEISRVCPGRGAGISEDTFLELYGSAGSAVLSLQDPRGVRVALGEDGRDPSRPLRHIDVPAEFLKLPGSARDPQTENGATDKRWSYRYDQAFQFVQSVRSGKSDVPSFVDGVRCQAVLEAALHSSETLSWVEVSQ
jgi:predicted dehydrogenase